MGGREVGGREVGGREGGGRGGCLGGPLMLCFVFVLCFCALFLCLFVTYVFICMDI